MVGVACLSSAGVSLADGTCKHSAALEPEGTSWLAPLPECGSYVLATEGAQSPWSWGAGILKGTLPDAYELSLRYRRLTHDRRPVEFHLPGGAVLISEVAWGFYESEAQFARDRWTTLAGHSNLREHRVRIVQRGKTVQVWLDGSLLGTRTFTAITARRQLRIGLKGYQGVRARVLLRDVKVRPAQ